MNNLHRELAPISDAAWAQIEEEASRTLKRYLAGRRVVDLQGPNGVGLSAVPPLVEFIPTPRSRSSSVDKRMLDPPAAHGSTSGSPL